MNIVERYYDIQNDTRLQIRMIIFTDFYHNDRILLFDWWSGRYFYGDTILPMLPCEEEPN